VPCPAPPAFPVDTSEIYVRANQNQVVQASNLLAATADPQNADGVQVSRPSDALEARAAAKGQFTTLLLGLGAVALLVGAIGIANIMVISVLERRGEIGLRRALGATRRHISSQFLTESAVLALLGGIAGLALGAGATEIYALSHPGKGGAAEPNRSTPRHLGRTQRTWKCAVWVVPCSDPSTGVTPSR